MYNYPPVLPVCFDQPSEEATKHVPATQQTGNPAVKAEGLLG